MRAVWIAALIALVAPAVLAETDNGTNTAAQACAPVDGETASVAEVIDGDTLVLADGRVVRLRGVEAPKAHLVRPGAEVGAVARAARQALERLTGGETLRIRFGEPERDRHGRFLGDIALADGTWLQDAMVGQGFARVRPFAGEASCVHALLERERQARGRRRGLWGEAEFSVTSAYHPSLIERKGLYVVVVGRVISVGHGDLVDFLNFGDVWQADLTVLVAAPVARRLAASGRSTDTMVGNRVLVRGIIEEDGGPTIRLTDPGEIEILGE